MGGPEVEHLIGLLAKLPGMGPRSARRAALRMLQHPEVAHAAAGGRIGRGRARGQTCADCGNLDSRDPCSICADHNRDRSTICVVEGVGDLWALERASVYNGLYHVLGGTLSALGGVRPEDLNVSTLITRIADGSVKEVILALGATVEGATTAHWLTDRLRPLGVTVTRVGQGVPMGGALDALDDGTIAAALRARRVS